MIPAAELKAMGHETHINEGEVDIVVLSKPDRRTLDVAKTAKKAGCKIVSDFCDDHFAHETLGETYREAAKLSDAIVAPTKVMAERVLDATGKHAEVIPDPYEFAPHAPHAGADERLLWFGHARNLPELQQWFPILHGCNLKIVTGDNTIVPYTRWSLQTMARELQSATCVLLPTTKGSEYKSPNRLVNAIQAGCFPICSPHPSYEEFKDMVWVGNLWAGLRFARAFRNDLNTRLDEAQAYVEKFSPQLIGQAWEKLFASI